MGIETIPLQLWGTISGTVGSFQSEGAFADWKALAIESWLMSGCGQGYEPPENGSKKLGSSFQF